MADKIYLHDHEGFHDLLTIVEEKTGIQAGLVEKDIGSCMLFMA
jgi:hypothetical protein